MEQISQRSNHKSFHQLVSKLISKSEELPLKISWLHDCGEILQKAQGCEDQWQVLFILQRVGKFLKYSEEKIGTHLEIR